jgi:hypothetical protein
MAVYGYMPASARAAALNLPALHARMRANARASLGGQKVQTADERVEDPEAGRILKYM